jgi:hypothetical protein
MDVTSEDEHGAAPPNLAKKSVVIVDLWNLRGTLKDSGLDENLNFSGIKSLLELFDLTPSLLHVVGPVMQLEHGAISARPSNQLLQDSRTHIIELVREASNVVVTTPVTSPV